MIFNRLENIELEKRTSLRVGSSDFISLNPLNTFLSSPSISDVLMKEYHSSRSVKPYAGSVEASVQSVDQYAKSVETSARSVEASAQSVDPSAENIGNRIVNYVYNHTDHLGNIRVSYSKDPVNNQLKIMEQNHYYPFGLKHQVYAASKMDFELVEGMEELARPTFVNKTDYQYKYNGKEFQDELGLGWYDYQARNYDPALGRWMNIDPLAEVARRFSPYAYALDNPVFFIDPDGMMATPPDWFVNNKNGEVVYFKGESEVTQEMLNNVNYDGDANSFERLGDDNMFGTELNTKEGVNILEKDFSALANSKEFMTSRGYSESEKVTVKESEMNSTGSFGNERVPLTTSDIKQIDETKMSYSKPNELVKSHTDLKPENILKETSGSSQFSSSKSITYNLTKPVGQDIRVTAQYYSNRQMDYGKAGTFVGEVGKIIRALFR